MRGFVSWVPRAALIALSVALCVPAQSSVAQVQQEYRMGPGDRLNVTVFGHPDLSGELVIDGTGRISMPLIGQVDANDKTITELQAEITGALDKDYIINPRVTVEVVNYRPFFILGQVSKPGSFSYIEGMTIRMAVALAGGYTRRGRVDPVIIIRANDPEQIRHEVSPSELVLPGDTIEVERRIF